LSNEVIPSLSRWAASTYPEYPYAYWGQSGAALLFDALCQERRKTIVLPAFICHGLAAMAAATGMTVVLVDVERDTLHPDPDRLEQCLARHRDSDTVLLVDHAFGYPFAALADVRRRHPGLLIVEDCVRALGSAIGGRAVGHAGDWTLLSLYKAVHGNNHGALLLTRTPYRMRSGPAPAATWRQRAATLRPLRVAYEWTKRRRPDFGDVPRRLGPPRWTPAWGTPNRLCLNRFAAALNWLDDDVARRRQAAAEIRESLGDLGGIRFIQPASGCETGAYFQSFTVSEGVARNRLLTSLHRRGLFLLRTWDVVPAFFDGFSEAFPFGSSESVFLADHIGHIPVGRFVNPRSRRRLVKNVRELVRAESARRTPALVPTADEPLRRVE
jgi:dTDP-4-amino-4,6-dideoxygalactose transaminase